MKFLKRFKKVLIIEDDPQIRSALAEKFAHEGYRVVKCSKGDDALTMIGREKPHGVVLDLMLPNTDGISILKSIRQGDMMPALPVVILTNLLGNAGLRDEARALNADYYEKTSTSLEEVVRVLSAKM
jgi:DNA-binding response OmpR family regulator